jgi:hypothetical protein
MMNADNVVQVAVDIIESSAHLLSADDLEHLRHIARTKPHLLAPLLEYVRGQSDLKDCLEKILKAG